MQIIAWILKLLWPESQRPAVIEGMGYYDPAKEPALTKCDVQRLLSGRTFLQDRYRRCSNPGPQ